MKNKTYIIIRKDGVLAKIQGSSLELSENGITGIVRDDAKEVTALVNLDEILAIHTLPA